MIQLPTVNSSMIQSTEGIEKTLLYLIRDIQEKEKALESFKYIATERTQKIQQLEKKIHELRK